MPRAFTCRAASGNDRTTIDEDIGNTFGILTWVFIAGALANNLRIEHDDIGRFAGLQHPAVTQMQDLCGETCHLADRLFECEQTQIAAVMSQNTRATAISTRMGPAPEQTVGAHGTPGGLQDVLDVVFANHEGNHPHGKVLVEQETHYSLFHMTLHSSCGWGSLRGSSESARSS